MNFDYSLHDAEIEAVTIGPRREICISLALGSARLSDERLPNAAILRMGAIKNFEQVRPFFARFELAPIARIDCVIVRTRVGPMTTIILEIDPQGLVEVVCAKLELIPNAAV